MGEGGVGVEGLLYRGKGAERWQRNVSLGARQKLARGLEASFAGWVWSDARAAKLVWHAAAKVSGLLAGEIQIAYKW